MSKNMLCVEVTISLYDLWPRERKSVRERYNFEGERRCYKAIKCLEAARGGLTRSIILLQRTRGVDKLSSRGGGGLTRSIILLQRTRGVDGLSSKGRGRSNKSLFLLLRTRGVDGLSFK